MSETGYTKEQQKENRQKWVDALRSGNYNQGHGKLINKRTSGETTYCCLGVACDVSGLGKWSRDFYVVDKDDCSSMALPDSVKHWLGLYSESGTFLDEERKYLEDHTHRIDDPELGDKCTSLIGLNDDGNFTFNDIADIIESEPKGFIR